MNSLVTYLKNVRAELAHVVWPSPRIAILQVVIIVLISAVMALIMAGLDYGFAALIQRVVVH